MKKLLFMLFLIITSKGYSQNLDSKEYVFSFGVLTAIDFQDYNSKFIRLPYFNIEIEFSKKFGGIGTELINNKKVNPNTDDVTNGVGLYYISPSIKDFDLIIGGGDIWLDKQMTKTYTTGDYVNGYYRSNGTWVNGYYRNVMNVTKTSLVRIDESKYFLLGIGKSFKISNGIYAHTRGILRYQKNYGYNMEKVIIPQIMFGIKFKL